VGKHPRAHPGSAAPALVYEEADLIKRSIRDLFNKDIDEIFVEGEDGFRRRATSCAC
jgi:Ribonuclease G/E